MSAIFNRYGVGGQPLMGGRGGDQQDQNAPNQGNQPPSNPPPPTGSTQNGPSFDRRSLPPRDMAQSQNHPDDLLSSIPFHRKSVLDFHNHHHPVNSAHGDVNPSLIPIIQNPSPDPEPDWRTHLAYYERPGARNPLENLQDLYIFLTRVGIPNAVIENRRWILDFYSANIHASLNLRLRYDAYPFPEPQTYVPPVGELQHDLDYTVINRSVFADYPTPDGARFLQWLRNLINVWIPNTLPSQMYHQPSLLDWYFNEDETAVRRVGLQALMKRTELVLRVFWWLGVANGKLKVYSEKKWEGMNGEMDE